MEREPEHHVLKIRIEKPPDEIAIEELGLSKRTEDCLTRAGVRTAGDITGKSDDELISILMFEPRNFMDLIIRLEAHGLRPRKAA